MSTSLTSGGAAQEGTVVGISSIMDTWLLVRDIESNGERNRVLNVLKSRGMAHSNQAREFLITDHGIDLVDTYLGPTGVMTGAARVAQLAHERADALRIQHEISSRQKSLQRKRATIEQRVSALHAQQETDEEEYRHFDEEARARALALNVERADMGRARHADIEAVAGASGKSRNGRSK